MTKKTFEVSITEIDAEKPPFDRPKNGILFGGLTTSALALSGLAFGPMGALILGGAGIATVGLLIAQDKFDNIPNAPENIPAPKYALGSGIIATAVIFLTSSFFSHKPPQAQEELRAPTIQQYEDEGVIRNKPKLTTSFSATKHKSAANSDAPKLAMVAPQTQARHI